MTQEQVNHPSHYCQHPAGIECIDIIRHYVCDIANAIKYLWRAGLKIDADKTAIAKEIEDLKKALWYIQDYSRNCVRFGMPLTTDDIDDIIYEVTGSPVERIITGYAKTVATAIELLLYVGIIFQGEVRHVEKWRENLRIASLAIMQRIEDLEIRKEEE